MHVMQSHVGPCLSSSSTTHCVEYIRKYATEEALCERNGDAASDKESDISDLSEDEADDMEL